jgi:hypothetical protein
MVEDLANRVMGLERAIWRVDLEMSAQGHSDNDPATDDGRKVVDGEGQQVSYKERKTRLRELIANLEAAYPTLMLAARKLIRKTRKEIDAHD